MEKNIDSIEQPQNTLKPFERRFGNKVIERILAGDDAVVVNPRFFGLGGYRREAVYPYMQDQLSEKGIATTIEETPIESGSDAPIPQHRLVVISRFETETDL